TTTRHPAPARPRAMPRPIPPLPPVTMATLPFRSNTHGLLGACKEYIVTGNLELLSRGKRTLLRSAACFDGIRVARRLHALSRKRNKRFAGGYLTMLAHVPSIPPRLGVDRDVQRSHVWTIVLTGDAPPTSTGGMRRRSCRTTSRWPGPPTPGAGRTLERA